MTTQSAHDSAMIGDSTGMKPLDNAYSTVKLPTSQPAEPKSKPELPDPKEQPTEHGCLYTRWDGIRVYVTEHHDVAKRFLCWGWPLHPNYTEYWCHQTGTYIFVALSQRRMLKAEAIAALPDADYKRWGRGVLDENESAELRAAKRRGRKQLRKALKHSQMRLNSHYHYENEVNAKRGMGWVPVNLQDWKLFWPNGVKEGSIEMSDERFSDVVKSGGVYGYKPSGKPVNDWYWYQQMPRAVPTSVRNDFSGVEHVIGVEYAIPPDATLLWRDEDANSDTAQAIEGAVDAQPIFPALVQAYTVGDGKNVRCTRVGRIEKMLAFIRYVYGPRAAVTGEVYLLAHCPEYTSDVAHLALEPEKAGKTAKAA